MTSNVMTDKVFTNFINQQHKEGMRLAEKSDILELSAIGRYPYQRYIACYNCRGLVKLPSGQVEKAEKFLVGIYFPSDYLRRCDPYQILTWMSPPHVWHPNITYHAPFVCAGKLKPGTALTEILYQLFEIITFNNVTMNENDALNAEACEWARNNTQIFPVDRSPLTRTMQKNETVKK